MKKRFRLLGLALIMSATAFWGLAQAEEKGLDKKTIGVRQYMKHVEIYSGPIIVEGVVSGVFPKKQMLGLIDVEEFRECKVVTCSRLTLPVRWEGPMPEVLSIVRVDGEMRKESIGLVFFASSLKKVRKEL